MTIGDSLSLPGSLFIFSLLIWSQHNRNHPQEEIPVIDSIKHLEHYLKRCEGRLKSITNPLAVLTAYS